MDNEDMQVIVFAILTLLILLLVVLIAQTIPLNMNSLSFNSNKSFYLDILIISGIVCFVLAIITVFLSLSE